MNPFKKLFDTVFPNSLNKMDINPALPIFKLYQPDQDKTEQNYNDFKDSLTDWLFCDN
jgi:hypothetical protein